MQSTSIPPTYLCGLFDHSCKILPNKVFLFEGVLLLVHSRNVWFVSLHVFGLCILRYFTLNGGFALTFALTSSIETIA